MEKLTKEKKEGGYNWGKQAATERNVQFKSRARLKPRPKRGFGNSFQPAIDAPRLEPHELRHCPKRKDGGNQF
ncbi:hypothetical protein CCACVL1_29252 [Corchorus capsularis]|uniref:Uncharacterized protein n=1 Tax=Corchorus capsularis TaxID=210143 RepID=A0A1R3G2R5_COCAP|nr:hypothetical protein CCACVL1_29252 [Corchorus capsularis]